MKDLAVRIWIVFLKQSKRVVGYVSDVCSELTLGIDRALERYETPVEKDVPTEDEHIVLPKLQPVIHPRPRKRVQVRRLKHPGDGRQDAIVEDMVIEEVEPAPIEITPFQRTTKVISFNSWWPEPIRIPGDVEDLMDA